MTPRILGLHHVTATVDEAQADLDFCLDLLGLRLVKKTVNFDNHNVFHFYYGDERGTPGTIWTTFPYKGYGVPAGRKGAGQITVTSFSIPEGSMEFWRTRLAAFGIAAEEDDPRFGDRVLAYTDPSGLGMELIESGRDARTGWITPDVDLTRAIRGVHGVTLTIASPGPTLEFMTSTLGFEVVAESPGRTRVAVGGDGPGHSMDIVDAPKAPRAMNGLGTVHHVAMAIADAEQQLEKRHALLAKGLQVTPVLDRQYFQSIYFREPGGVLFEIATMGPGFLVDEPLAELGHSLKLPPWEEPYRSGIEAGLAEVQTP